MICKKSFVEANINTLIGMPIAYVINVYMVRSNSEDIISGNDTIFVYITLVITLASILRNYIIRIIFKRLL